MAENPTLDTLLVAISRVSGTHPLVEEARWLGLNVVVGNTHALEIWENGLPLGYALRELLPEVEIVLFRERCFSLPLDRVGNDGLRKYGRQMADAYLLARARGEDPKLKPSAT